MPEIRGYVTQVRELEGMPDRAPIASVSIEGVGVLFPDDADWPMKGQRIVALIAVRWPKSDGSGEHKRPTFWAISWRPLPGD